MAALENNLKRGAATVETAGNIQEMAREIEALAKPGSGMKVETTQSKASLPSMERTATAEESVKLPSIDFGKTDTDLTPQQRQAIRDALKGVDPEKIERLHVEIAGGNTNGRLTPIRADNIRAEIARVLGHSVDGETNISAEKGAYLHKLDTNVYVTLRDEAATDSKARGGGSKGGGVNEILTKIKDYNVSAGYGLDGVEVQLGKDGAPWDVRVGVGSGLTLAATRSIGTEDLGKDKKGNEHALDFRAGPFIDTQSGDGLRVGGEVLMESKFGGTKPYVGLKVGVGSDGLEPSVAAGFTVDLWGGDPKAEKKK